MADSNQIRINELARELEIKAKVLIEFLPEIGVTEKKTHSSSLDLEHAELAPAKPLTAPGTTAPAPSATAKPAAPSAIPGSPATRPAGVPSAPAPTSSATSAHSPAHSPAAGKPGVAPAAPARPGVAPSAPRPGVPLRPVAPSQSGAPAALRPAAAAP